MKNIKTVVYYLVFAVIVLILTVPVSLCGYGYADSRIKKFLFSVKLFGAIGIFGGYAEFKEGIVFVHYSEKKAFAFGIFDSGPFLPINVFKEVSVIELKWKTILPIDDVALYFALADNLIKEKMDWLIRAFESRLIVSGDTDIGKDDHFSISVKAVFAINVLSLILLIFKLKRRK